MIAEASIPEHNDHHDSMSEDHSRKMLLRRVANRQSAQQSRAKKKVGIYAIRVKQL
jgi:hypothetical protein